MPHVGPVSEGRTFFCPLHWRLGRSIHSRALFGLSPRAKMGPSKPNFWLELSPTPISKMID
jgi:hypothetical protein